MSEYTDALSQLTREQLIGEVLRLRGEESRLAAQVAKLESGIRSTASSFDGCKVFSATMFHQRQTLGEEVTAWIEAARRQRPGFQIVDIVVRQSSDEAFHCVTIVVFFNENLGKEKKRRD
jgi:hypothetical protein